MSRLLSVTLIAGLTVVSPVYATAQSPTPIPSARDSQYGDMPQAKPARPGAPAQPAPPAPLPAPPGPVAVLPPPPPPAPPAPPLRGVNVQLEFTITDQKGSGAPDKKTVSMMTSNGTWGRIRASATVRPGPERGGPPVPVSLNVDARPYMAGNDAIQTEITIEYRPVGATIADEPVRMDPTILNQSLTVILQSGKSMVISQAADPITDRKIVVEVKATVLK